MGYGYLKTLIIGYRGQKLLLMVVKVYMEMHINNMCGIR